MQRGGEVHEGLAARGDDDKGVRDCEAVQDRGAGHREWYMQRHLVEGTKVVLQ